MKNEYIFRFLFSLFHFCYFVVFVIFFNFSLLSLAVNPVFCCFFVVSFYPMDDYIFIFVFFCVLYFLSLDLVFYSLLFVCSCHIQLRHHYIQCQKVYRQILFSLLIELITNSKIKIQKERKKIN